MTIAFTGGGTGGHIYPGLAVAAEIKNRLPDARIIWLGSFLEIDKKIITESGIDSKIIDEFFGIPSGKLRRYFSLKNFTDIFKILAGFFASIKILKRQKVKFLFSKGGFVSVPPCAAAAFSKIPVFTHESDYSPGLATKINSHFVLITDGKIFTAYKDTVNFFKEKYKSIVVHTGQPVRKSFREANAENGIKFLNLNLNKNLNNENDDEEYDNERILLVLGGSQGAQEVNDLAEASLNQITKYYTVVHQTGPALEWNLKRQKSYIPLPYINKEMPDVMAASEIIMGRSGAGIFEWAVCGKPMILIPLCGSGTRGDQVENAKYFEKQGAAIVFDKETGTSLIEKNECAQVLASIIENLANNPEKRKTMAEASLKIGEMDACKIIAEKIL